MYKKGILTGLMAISVTWSSLASADEIACRDLFAGKKSEQLRNGPPSFLAAIKENVSRWLNISQNKENISEDAPIPLTQKSRLFRKKYLEIFKNPDQREAVIQKMEADARIRSFKVTESLSQNSENYYDLTLIGLGPHNVVFLTRFLKLNPNARVLIIEKNDTAGSTFRYLGDALTINSSNRASGEGRLPLPGFGNINELPGLPIQVSEMTGVKYPTGNDLSSAIISGFYSNIYSNPRVETVFRAEVLEAITTSNKESPKYSTGAVVQLSNGKQTTVRSLLTVAAPGIGVDRIPVKVQQTLASNPGLITPAENEKIAKVVSVADILRDINLGKFVLDSLKDKTIVIAGDGDYSYVFIEALLGYMVNAGFGGSTAQTIGPKKIIWLGQNAKTCEEFIEKIRSRYQNISTGFRNSAAGLKALIEPVPEKLDGLSMNGEKIQATAVDGQNYGGDHLVLAAGLEGQFRNLFAEGMAFDKDSSFYDSKWNRMKGYISTGKDGQSTNIGVNLKSNPNFFLVGPAVKLVREDELTGPIQNYVSLFNNAPRSYALADQVSNIYSQIKDSMSQNSLKTTKISENIEVSANYRGAVKITQLSDKKSLKDLSEAYYTAVFKSALKSLSLTNANVKLNDVRFVIGLNSDKKTLTFDAIGNIDVARVAEVLASTRDFFNLSREFLLANPQSKIVFDTRVTGNKFLPDETQFSFQKSVRLTKPEQVVANASLQNSLKRSMSIEKSMPDQPREATKELVAQRPTNANPERQPLLDFKVGEALRQKDPNALIDALNAGGDANALFSNAPFTAVRSSNFLGEAIADAQDENGLKIIEILLKAGANPNRKSPFFYGIPLAQAINIYATKKSPEIGLKIIKLLRVYGANFIDPNDFESQLKEQISRLNLPAEDVADIEKAVRGLAIPKLQAAADVAKGRANETVNFKSILDVQKQEDLRKNISTAISNGLTIETIEKSLLAGANPNARDEKGTTLLSRAIAFDRADVVQLLLEYGADPNYANFRRNLVEKIVDPEDTPRVTLNSVKIIELLLSYGYLMPLNTRTGENDLKNYTTTFLGQRFRQVPELKDEPIESILGILKTPAKPELIQMVKRSPYVLALEAAKKESYNLKFISITESNDFTKQLRGELVKRDNRDIVKIRTLLDQGAQLDLYSATLNAYPINNFSTLVELLERGASPNLVLQTGRTLLQTAIENFTSEQEPVIRLLLTYGAVPAVQRSNVLRNMRFPNDDAAKRVEILFKDTPERKDLIELAEEREKRLPQLKTR